MMFEFGETYIVLNYLFTSFALSGILLDLLTGVKETSEILHELLKEELIILRFFGLFKFNFLTI